MGKASRWMINLLLGKKEEKRKHKKSISFSEKTPSTPSGSIPSSPYRRWSFGKSSSKETAHKFSNSLDSITPLITQHAAAALNWETQPKNKTKIKTIQQTKTIISLRDAAATRIQAAFRSYLAKKALCALRGLVKIQALVRGHLVRKQTTATMRQMHALMSIQVRARFNRIQMAEETKQLAVRSQSSRLSNFSHETGLRSAYREAFDWDIYGTEKRPRKYYSGELAVSKRDQQYEFPFSTAHNSPQNRSPASTAVPARASFSYQKAEYMNPVTSPNYMSNTESSRARLRSQSEPKQRPASSTRPKRKTASIDGINANKQNLSTQTISPIMHEDGDPWFIKLYDATKPKRSDYDVKSAASSSNSNYSKLLVTYEPHLNLY